MNEVAKNVSPTDVFGASCRWMEERRVRGSQIEPAIFWAIEHEADLVGYCCFGHEARVPGVVEEEGILDVGYGMRPDLMGQGLGREFVGAILDFAVRGFSPRRLRMLILDWNDRSRKVADALGFQSEGVLRSTDGDFLVMTREAPEGHCGATSRRHLGE